MLYTESLKKDVNEVNDLNKESFEERLAEFSKSISPVLIPVINELGKMKENQSVGL